MPSGRKAGTTLKLWTEQEIEWLKECVTVSNNDTKYYRDKYEEAVKEIEDMHDRLAMVIGQRDEERLAR